MRRLDLRALFILIILCIVQAAYYYPRLPDSVASHFNASGQPDSWSSKDSFVFTNLAMIAGISIVCLGIVSLLRRIPVSWINLPNKDYWLAPERKDDTLSTLSVQFGWLACATVALFIAMFQLTILANLSTDKTLGNTSWLFIGIYLAFTVIWIIRLLRRFGRVP
jgi:uncharacterized membrane protein